ncbi:MAG: hypothetical protein AB7O73_06215 [Bacteroidia bacterium]
MIWDGWIPKKFYVKSEICSIEAVFSENGVQFFYTLLKQNKQSLDIVLKGEISSIKDLPVKIIKSKIPVILIVNGRGIIIKPSICEESNPTEEFVLNQLPAINPEEFYIQYFSQDNQQGFISFCRKEQVNGVIDEIKKLKLALANVYIGATTVLGLKPFFSQFNNIPTTKNAVEITNEKVEKFTVSDNQTSSIQIGDMQVEKEHVLGLSAGMTYLMQRRINTSYDKLISDLMERHIESNKFRFLTLLTVAILFVIAVTNMLVYSNRYDLNNKLETELAVYQGKYEQINQMLSDYQSKKGLIEDAGLLNRNRLSEYADRIATTIPKEVVLTSLHFNPEIESDDYQDSVKKFNSSHIIVQGNCKKSLVINEWLNVLKMQNFIGQVNLVKFNYDKNDLMPNFEINVTTK